jgi:ribosomal protein S27AE
MSFDSWKATDTGPYDDGSRECSRCGAWTWTEDDAERPLCGGCEEHEATVGHADTEPPCTH